MHHFLKARERATNANNGTYMLSDKATYTHMGIDGVYVALQPRLHWPLTYSAYLMKTIRNCVNELEYMSVCLPLQSWGHAESTGGGKGES